MNFSLNALVGAFFSKSVWINVALAAVNAYTNGLADVGLSVEVYSLIQVLGNLAVRAITSVSLSDKGAAVKAKLAA